MAEVLGAKISFTWESQGGGHLSGEGWARLVVVAYGSTAGYLNIKGSSCIGFDG